jgi:hypothetical protein
MSTSPINPMPFGGPERDPDSDPDLETPDVRTRPSDDSPLTESADPPPTAPEEEPDDQLPRDPDA